ncbi:flippase [Candidatus Woesearchaeota archaeon]|nr:flippase [Candidatus Woesearchaeota archaeon]
MNLRSTILNSLGIFILTIIGGLCGYLFRIILARNMSVAEYGLFYAMFSFLAFGAVFIDIGITQSCAKRIVELGIKKEHNRIRNLLFTSTALQFLTSFTLSIIFLAFFEPLAARFFPTENKTLLILLLIWFVTLPTTMLLQALFLGTKNVKTYSAIDPIKTIMAALLAATFFWIGLSSAPFIAYALMNLLALIIFAPLAYRAAPYLKGALQFDLPAFKEVFTYGIFLTFSNLAWAIITYTDTIMITAFKGAEQVGYYQIAMPLSNTLLYIMTALNIVAYPLFTHLNAERESQRIKQGITLLYNYLFVAMIPLALVMFSYPEIVITLLFGSSFTPAADALRILSIGAVFFSLSSFNCNLLSATGHAKKVAYMSFLTAAINVAANFMLIPRFGFVGAAYATLMSFMTLLLISTYQTTKTHPVKIPYLRWSLNFAIGFAVLRIIGLLKEGIELNQYLEASLILIIIAPIYIALLFLLRVLTIQEIKTLLATIISSK